MTETNDPKHDPAPGEEYVPNLAHHFNSLRQQFDAAKLGMWFFLVTEVLFFGGLLCAYAVYRGNRPEVFVDGHHFLDTPLGAANTVVLIFSSLTMALAVRCAQLGQRAALVGLLAVTLLCGLAFLGIKSTEYKQKWDHRLVPGQARIEYWTSREYWQPSANERALLPPKEFSPDEEYLREHFTAAGYGELDKKQFAAREANLQSFMGIYFALTALHALHVLIGIGVITWLLIGSLLGRYGPNRFTPVDLVGLYWHLVDMIWIFLFPLLYLIH